MMEGDRDKKREDLLSSTEAPTDRRSLAYYIMFYLGVGNLFPWNAFITASTYYSMRFCGTAVEDSFENYFSTAYTLSQTIGLALSIQHEHRFSLQQKIAQPLVLYASIFAVTSALVLVINIDPMILFGLTLISACLSGLVGAMFSSGLFGLGAMLPKQYTGAIMSGQGLAGMAVSLSAILTQYAGGDTSSCDDDGSTNDDGDTCEQSTSFSALAYFLIATFVLISCIFSFSSLMRMKFTRYYVALSGGNRDDVVVAENPLLQYVVGEDDPGFSATATLLNPQVDRRADHKPSPPLQVFKQVIIPAASVWATFAVTIGVFPALTVFLESTEKCKSHSSRFSNDLFVPFLFLLCNIFDFSGRLAAGSSCFPHFFTAENIWIAALARLIFFPLFLLCNVADSKLPTLFNHDAFPMIFMSLMAFTNGYVASQCMMMGGNMVSEKNKSLAGTIMSFSLTVGLLTGSCLSFLVVYIAEGTL